MIRKALSQIGIVTMESSRPADPQSNGLEERIAILEAERDCRELLARYGFYADHGLSDEWVDLYTDDAVMDFWYFEDDEYFDDEMHPRDVDLRTLNLPLKNGRFVGRKELFDCINAPRHLRIVDRAQHQMDGHASIFRMTDDATAVIVSNSLVVARSEGHHAPMIQYQNYCLNRWTFRRVEGRWLIAENLRRPMGSGGASELLAGI
jgi:hypothetical protein